MAPDPSLFLSPLPARSSVEAEGDEAATAPDGPPPPRPGASRSRRVAVSAVVATLAVGAVVANRAGAGREPVAGPAPTTTTTAAGSRALEGTPPSTTPALPATLTTVARLGPLLPDPSGTTLVVASSERLLVVDIDTGTVRVAAVPGLDVWGGAPFSSVLPVGADLLVGGSVPHLVGRAEGGAVRPAGPPVATGLLPSAVDGRWWTLDHRFGAELVERDAQGETGRQLRFPSDSGAILAHGDGFLASPGATVLALDAATGQARRVADGTAVAVDARTLVRTRCDESLECGLVLSDIAGGGERVVGTPTPRSRYETYAGIRFSPDGRWLVVPFYGEDQPGGLVLIDVARGRRHPMDFLTTASRGGFPATGVFTADSRWLLVGDPTDDARPIKALRIEDGAAVDIDLGDRGRGGEGGITMVAVPSVPADR